jgi:hypothetical protein
LKALKTLVLLSQRLLHKCDYPFPLRRKNASNLSSIDGLSKEIENHEQEQQELGFEQWSGDFSGERVKWQVER